MRGQRVVGTCQRARKLRKRDHTHVRTDMNTLHWNVEDLEEEVVLDGAVQATMRRHQAQYEKVIKENKQLREEVKCVRRKLAAAEGQNTQQQSWIGTVLYAVPTVTITAALTVIGCKALRMFAK